MNDHRYVRFRDVRIAGLGDRSTGTSNLWRLCCRWEKLDICSVIVGLQSIRLAESVNCVRTGRSDLRPAGMSGRRFRTYMILRAVSFELTYSYEHVVPAFRNFSSPQDGHYPIFSFSSKFSRVAVIQTKGSSSKSSIQNDHPLCFVDTYLFTSCFHQ